MTAMTSVVRLISQGFLTFTPMCLPPGYMTCNKFFRLCVWAAECPTFNDCNDSSRSCRVISNSRISPVHPMFCRLDAWHVASFPVHGAKIFFLLCVWLAFCCIRSAWMSNFQWLQRRRIVWLGIWYRHSRFGDYSNEFAFCHGEGQTEHSAASVNVSWVVLGAFMFFFFSSRMLIFRVLSRALHGWNLSVESVVQ